MLRLTADVNGKPIGYLYIHNSSRVHNGANLYNAALWNPNTHDGVFGIEDVPHPRAEGWAALVLRVLRRYSPEL